VLGTASAALAISISRADLDRALAAQEADARLSRAKALAAKGRLDEAIALAGEAVKLDADSREAAALSETWSSSRKVVQEQVAVSRGWMAKKDYGQAAAAWRKARDAQPDYGPVRELEDDLKTMKRAVDRAQGLVHEGYAQEQRGNMAGAIAKYEAAAKFVPDPKLDARIAELKQGLAEAEAQRLVNEGYEHEKSGDMAGAIACYEKALGLVPDERVAARVGALKASASAQ
jgi:tetratricopeptide (TPR) repeat protein